MHKYARYFLVTLIITSNSIHSMGFVRGLGSIDKRLIQRYAHYIDATTLITKIKKAHPAQLIPRPPTQVVDIVHFKHTPAVKFNFHCFLYDSERNIDLRISLDHPFGHPKNYIYSSDERVNMEKLAFDINKRIAAIETKSGYIPEGIVKQDKDSVSVTMATNRLCENTRYWHAGDCDRGCDYTYIVTETTLYREHHDEVEELLKNQLNLP